MKFVEYLKNLYQEKTEGFSHYDGGSLEDSFQDDLNSFFESLLIWTNDQKVLAEKFGAEIIPAAMHIMAAEELEPARYTDLQSFINLAFRYVEESHYNEFKEIFKQN